MMNKFFSLTKTSQRVIILTAVLLLYGYLCRLLGLYFFWESKYIGWSLVCVAVIFLLRERMQSKKLQEKKTVSEKVAIGLMIFLLTVQAIMLIVIPRLDAYKIAREFLETNQFISDAVGEVTSITFIPMGGFSSTKNSAGETGQADLNFIVKGKSKFRDFNMQLVKEVNSDWIIVNVR